MKTADELIQEARARARSIDPKALPSLDVLRIEAKAIFEALPEPPAYKRASDPTPAQAEQQIGPARALLARLYALGDSASRVTALHGSAAPPAPAAGRDGAIQERGIKKVIGSLRSASRQAGALPLDSEAQASLGALTRAAELHLRALAALSAAQIVEADLLASEARSSARAAQREGLLFRFVGQEGPMPVFDRASGVSRYDPRPGQRLKVQLTCMGSRCHRRAQFELPAQMAFHRLCCPQCGQAFSALLGHATSLCRTNHGVTSHYALRFELLGEGPRLLEFDDASQRPFEAGPGDFLAFIYACTGTLAAIENLTTGALHKVVPKGACFVATMAFGARAPELDAFRAFRDAHLLPHPLGRAFVRAYYLHGAALADLLSRTALTRKATRRALAAVHGHLVRAPAAAAAREAPKR